MTRALVRVTVALLAGAVLTGAAAKAPPVRVDDWDRGAPGPLDLNVLGVMVHLDKVVYRIIADATTRFNNLRSGDADVLDTVATTDVEALKSDPNLRLLTSDSLGYQGITVNLGNANGVGKPAGTLAAPYAEQVEYADLETPPRPEEIVQETFCGT